MKDDTQGLLDGIGQPGFHYRSFDKAGYAGPLARWPLLALVAMSPRMRDTPIGRKPVGASARRGEVRPGFLHAYNPEEPKSAAGVPATNVRSLLDRLSGDRA